MKVDVWPFKVSFRVCYSTINMRTTLALRAYRIHHYLSRFLCFPFFVNWDKSDEKWKLEKKRWKLVPFIVIKFGILGLSYGLAGFMVSYAYSQSTPIFTLQQIISFAVLFVQLPISLGCDVLLLIHGEEMIGVTNWLLEQEMHFNDFLSAGKSPMLQKEMTND